MPVLALGVCAEVVFCLLWLSRLCGHCYFVSASPQQEGLRWVSTPPLSASLAQTRRPSDGA